MPRSSLLNVPYTGVPEVESRDRPQAWQNLKVHEDMFGAGKGRALQQLGSTIASLADTFGAIEQKNQAEQADTLARKADTDMMQKVSELQTEFHFKTADEQSNGFPDYDKRLKQLTTDNVQRYSGGNQKAQKLIASAAERHYRSGWKFGFETKTGAVEKAADETSVARINTAIETAAKASNENALKGAIETINGETAERGRRQRWTPERIDDETFKMRSTAFARFIGNIANRDPAMAQQYLDTYGKEISDNDTHILNNKIKAGHKAITMPDQARKDAEGLPPEVPQKKTAPAPTQAEPPQGIIAPLQRRGTQGKTSDASGRVQVADASGAFVPSAGAPPRQSAEEYLKTRGLGINQVPIGMTVNNPGNLKYTGSEFQIRNFPGISKSHTRDQGDPQAAFPTPQHGMNAAATLAVTKFNQGMTTVGQIIADPVRGWTPKNRLAAEAIAGTMGVGVNQEINLRDPAQLSKFLHAVVKQEHGGQYQDVYPKEMKDQAAATALGVVPPAAGEERPIQQRTLAGYQESKVIKPGAIPKNLTPAATNFAGRLASEFPEVRITSGYRDPKHNEKVGGAKGSQHMHGKALDLDMSKMSEEQQAAVLDAALRSGAKGIGYYGNGKMHIDFRDNAAAWGPDTTSGTLGRTPQWFRERAALLTGGKIVPDQGVPLSTGGVGVASARPMPAGVRVASLQTSGTASDAPQPGFGEVRQAPGPGNLYAQVQTTSGPMVTAVDQTPRSPITAETTLEELNKRINEGKERLKEANYDKDDIAIYEQEMRSIHTKRVQEKNDLENRAMNALKSEAVGDPEKGKEQAQTFSDVVNNPNKPEMREYYDSLSDLKKREYREFIEKINSTSAKRRTPTDEDVKALHGYMAMAGTNPEAFLALEFHKMNLFEGYQKQLIQKQVQVAAKGNISATTQFLNTAMHTAGVEAQLRAMKIAPPIGEERANPDNPYYQIKGALEAEVEVYRKYNNGAMPSEDWVNKKVNDLLRASSVSKGTKNPGGLFGGIKVLVGKGDDEIKYEYQFPDKYKAEMEAYFKSTQQLQTPAKMRQWLIKKRQEELAERLP